MASVTTAIPGLVLTEHEFSLPLDHARPDGERIGVFAREVAAPEGRERPWLVFLQGGPGSEAPRQIGPPSGWLARALQDFRVLMLDQRGTGRSTPVGTLPGMTPAEQAEHLTHFRADAIVRDAELIRAELGIERWSVLGQSFGGFCVMHYLSSAPDSLREAFLTGGLAPVGRHPDEVYAATFARTLDRCRRYYERYPRDRARVLAVLERLEHEDVRLPRGDRLTPRRFRQLGYHLGASDGAERLHALLELPLDSPAFRHDVQDPMGVERNPLYAIVHESSYSDGDATRWSAERVMPPEYAAEPELLTGEHVFPWMFEDYGALAPLREAAELLAAHEWPRLYDAEQLRANEVPVAAAGLRRRPLRRADLLRGDGGADPRCAAVGDQRVRAQRAARRRRPGPRTPDRPRARARLTAVPKRSAGILLHRREGTEVLLVHPGGPFWAKKDLGAWSIPKGEVDEGEDPQACALRELAEETGMALELGELRDLGEIRQKGGKLVRAWATAGDLDADAIASNTFELEWPPRSGRTGTFPEVDRAAWFALAEARERILPAQAELLDRLERGTMPPP